MYRLHRPIKRVGGPTPPSGERPAATAKAMKEALTKRAREEAERMGNALVHPNPASFKAFTHDFHNNENVSATSGDYGKANPDGTVSITE